jgi:hypothetical protein
MKNIKFLLGLLAVVVIASSCVTTQGATDDDYMNGQRTEQIGNRVYLQDPYYGTVVLERDPFTGRYYDVTYGPRYGAGYYRYPYGNRVYRTAPRGGTVGGGKTIQQQRPTQQQIQQNRSEARRKLLGN